MHAPVALAECVPPAWCNHAPRTSPTSLPPSPLKQHAHHDRGLVLRLQRLLLVPQQTNDVQGGRLGRGRCSRARARWRGGAALPAGLCCCPPQVLTQRGLLLRHSLHQLLLVSQQPIALPLQSSKGGILLGSLSRQAVQRLLVALLRLPQLRLQLLLLRNQGGCPPLALLQLSLCRAQLGGCLCRRLLCRTGTALGGIGLLLEVCNTSSKNKGGWAHMDGGWDGAEGQGNLVSQCIPVQFLPV